MANPLKNNPQSPVPSRPHIGRSPSSNPNFSTLPLLVTNPNQRRTSSTRVPSFANKRTSVLSNASNTSNQQNNTLQQSVGYPVFQSSLSYSSVRDFAYETYHPLHYGPTMDTASRVSTPASEYPRRLSDPPISSWSGVKSPWSAGPSSVDSPFHAGPQLPQTSYADGPPWREDDDLLSPVVTGTKHRKTKSNVTEFDYRPQLNSSNENRSTSFAGKNNDGTETYYVDEMGESLPNGPGGEIITLPVTDQPWPVDHRDEILQPRSYYSSPDISPNSNQQDGDDDSRYSKDYSFTIASLDEEMHGKAVALFDFESENDNELPLVEGQVLWVSYRHGQGWLVAQDPRSGESGLVPEEYVRLARDIEGGLATLNGLNGVNGEDDLNYETDPNTPIAPTTTSNDVLENNNSTTATSSARLETSRRPGSSARPESSSSGKPAFRSHFSTSSQDLKPYSRESLRTQIIEDKTHSPRSSDEPTAEEYHETQKRTQEMISEA